MRIIGAPPAWALDIVRAEARRHHRPMPDIYWRVRRKEAREPTSSGSACPPGFDKDYPQGVICVTVGTDRQDQQAVLLHEIAHWLGSKVESHSPKFWERAWVLFRRYKLPVGYIHDRWHNFRGTEDAYWKLRRKEARS